MSAGSDGMPTLSVRPEVHPSATPPVGERHAPDFYAHLRAHYDVLFPLDRARPEFLLSQVRGRRGFLDLGCATGTLCSALVADFEAVQGWDLDAGFLDLARKRCRTFANLRFEERDLREVGRSPFHADLVTCLGNTLVHLDSPEAILRTLRGVRRILHRDGALVVQTVNYDGLESLEHAFPPIEREGLRFLRTYRPGTGGRVDFTTVLESPEGRSEAVTSLLPLKAHELEALGREAGFGSTTLRGSYSRRAWSPSAPATIAILRR
jgi:SAM-dependent methyltransferase